MVLLLDIIFSSISFHTCIYKYVLDRVLYFDNGFNAFLFSPAPKIWTHIKYVWSDETQVKMKMARTKIQKDGCFHTNSHQHIQHINDTTMTTSMQSPTFIDSFGFHLAIGVCGQRRLSDTLSPEGGDHQFESSDEGSRKRSLYWRSSFLPLHRCDERDGNDDGNEQSTSSKNTRSKRDQHVFFIDVTVDFIRPSCTRTQVLHPPRVETRFGAMLELPAESHHTHDHEHESTRQSDRIGDEVGALGGAVYIQSDPWQIQDVEHYSPDSVCVDSTGAIGCAETISNAILHGKPNMIKAKDYHVSEEGGRLSVRIVTFDNELLEEVTILIARNIIIQDCHVGPKALEMFQLNANTYSRISDDSGHDGTDIPSGDVHKRKEFLVETFKEWFKSNEEISPTDSFNEEQYKNDTNLSGNDGERNDISTQSQRAWEMEFFHDINQSQSQGKSQSQIQSQLLQSQSQTQSSQEVMSHLQATSAHQTQEDASGSEQQDKSASGNPPKTPKKKLRVVHGAARSRKRRKKGKMTIGKL